MSPEQWLGQSQNAKSDQYSLAVLLYELIGGEVPYASAFNTNDPVAMLHAIKEGEIEPLEQLSAKRNQVMMRAMAKAKQERWPDCSAVVKQLKQPSSSISTKAAAESHGTSGTRKGRSPRKGRPALVLALLLAIGFAAFYGYTYYVDLQKMQTGWNAAKAQSSETVYNEFAATYPDSPYTSEALSRALQLKTQREAQERAHQAMEVAWRNAQASHTDAVYNEFAATYPDSPYASDALTMAFQLKTQREQREAEERAHQAMEAAWRNAQASNTESAYQFFVSTYPDSPHVSEAQTKVEEIRASNAWRAAKLEDTELGYSEFYLAYPQSPYASQAQSLSIKIRREREQREAEESAFKNAVLINTELAYEQFVEDYPQSKFASRARATAAAMQAERIAGERKEAEQKKRIEALKKLAGRYVPSSTAWFGHTSSSGWIDIKVSSTGVLSASGNFSETWRAEPMYKGEDDTVRTLSGIVSGIEISDDGERIVLNGSFSASGSTWTAPASRHYRRVNYMGSTTKVSGEISHTGMEVAIPYTLDGESGSAGVDFKRK